MGHPHVVVIGSMGVGKSTVASALSRALDCSVRDSDGDIERLFGLTGAQVHEMEGLDRLHELERAVLLGALSSNRPSVIAAAASVLEDRLARLAIGRRSRVIELRAPSEIVLSRQTSGDHRRAMSSEEHQVLEQRRAPLARELAPVVIDATLPVPTIVDGVIDQLGLERVSARQETRGFG